MGQETPGLRTRKRKGGADALYWCATAEAVKAGFMPRTVNLSMHRDNPVLLSRACKRLDAEQRAWLAGKGRNRNDTIESHRRMRKTIAGTPSGTRDNGE